MSSAESVIVREGSRRTESTTAPMRRRRAEAGLRVAPALIVEPAGGTPWLAPVGPGGAVVGAGEDCDIPTPGAYVSRRHCVIRVTAEGLSVQDLGSRNGTEVDGKAVVRGQLEDGALLHLGDVSLTVVELVSFRCDHADGDFASPAVRFQDIVGANAESMVRFHRINKLAQSRAAALVAGPSGAGKELVARAIHRRSPVRSGPFVVLNCGALPPTLAEAELFGARRGAFTGAVRDSEGAFARAHGGTLFLDEVGELPLDVQPKLLRCLETGEVTPLGGATARRVDVRIVSATNRRLWDEAREGRFREDLLYRLDAVRVRVPPLTERVEDIVPIARALLRGCGGDRVLSAAGARWLEGREWPGNVRELRNLLQAAAALTRRLELGPRELQRVEPVDSPTAPENLDIQDRALLAALQRCDGKRKLAIQELGLPRSTFYGRLQRLKAAGALPPNL